MSQHEDIPLYCRPVSHSFTQTNIDIDNADTTETVETVATVAVLDKSGRGKIKVMSGMEHAAAGEGSRSMDLLLNKGDFIQICFIALDFWSNAQCTP